MGNYDAPLFVAFGAVVSLPTPAVVASAYADPAYSKDTVLNFFH